MGKLSMGVPLSLTAERQQESKDNCQGTEQSASEPICGALLAEEPGADEDGRRSDGAEAKESRTAGDRQKEGETDKMKKH